MNSNPTEVQGRIAGLHVYPVKSCAGVSLTEVPLFDTGLDLDRAWMVVDEDGEFVSQRELPRMALIRPQIRYSDVVLRAPGMLALHLGIDTVEGPVLARVWDDEVKAYDMGAVAAQWFSDFLGRKLRLVRFDPEQRRLSSRDWTGEAEAPNQFSDGFPLLVASQASLDELNARLAAAGHAPVTMERFRPNIVLDALDAQDEDRLDALTIGAEGAVQLRLVKPCPRCPIPDIDPADASITPHVGDMLRTYRSNARVGGAVSFGMNAIVVRGDEQVLRVGDAFAANWRFAG